MTALGELFQAARDIMNWLGDCAKVSFCVIVSHMEIKQNKIETFLGL